MKKKIPQMRLAMALPLVWDSVGYAAAIDEAAGTGGEPKLVPQNWQNWESSWIASAQ